MRKISIQTAALLLLCLVGCTSCQAGKGKPQPNRALWPDSLVYATLGKTMSEVLFAPSQVNCYLLKGKSKVDSTDLEIEPHWVRDSALGRLTPQLYGVLQFALLASDNNYHTDSVRVRSPYVPLLEFEFVRKKQAVHVLISTSDFTWTIMYDDKRQVHFNYADKKLINRFCKLFYNLDEK